MIIEKNNGSLRESKEVNASMQKSENKSAVLGQYINQKELLKELHIGFATLQKLRLLGLEAVQIGRQKYYDVEDVKAVFNQLKK